MIRAFTTSRNKPNVIMVIGIVRMISIGLTNTFAIEIKIAARSA
jgi:hypothetical protein